MPTILTVFANEVHRRALDRSAVITAVVAPLALAGILGFAFAGRPTYTEVRLGVTGAAPALVEQAAAQLPPGTTVRRVADGAALRRQIAAGSLQGGVEVRAVPRQPAQLLHPALEPGTGRLGPGVTVLAGTSIAATTDAGTLAAAVADGEYASALEHRVGAAAAVAPVTITDDPIGNGGRHVLDFFAPSVAVLFLFMGAGLGTRSLLRERTQGTLLRLAAAPVSPGAVVAGKLLAVLVTSLASLLAVWGVTTVAFGADWGSPVGVLLMCVAAAWSMCGVAVFLTSFARSEQEAFGISMLLGLVLALVGGNLVPPGALPPFFQTLSLGTPNGWAVVGFGRLALEGEATSAVLVPVAVLGAIGVAFGGAAAVRVRRMVRP